MEELRSIEHKEYRYLIEIEKIIKERLKFILNRFASRFDTYKYWAPLLETERKRLTDLGVGAERVFNHVIVSVKSREWFPVPIPFGSNLFFEAKDAYINIDIKTVYLDNPRDYLGCIEVGEAQTSYPMKKKYGARKEFQPKLKPYYDVGGIRKYCLTYVIQVIHVKPEEIIEHNWDPNPVMTNIICVPNGLLYNIYGDDIVKYPKSYHTEKGVRVRPANFRYYYYLSPRFKILKKYHVIPDKYNYRIRIFFNSYYMKKVRKYKDIWLNPRYMTKMSSLPDSIITYF